MSMLADALTAYQALISLLFLPAVAMLAAGAYFWYNGVQDSQPDKKRLGMLMTMFGVIFVVILAILRYFLTVGPGRWN